MPHGQNILSHSFCHVTSTVGPLCFIVFRVGLRCVLFCFDLGFHMLLVGPISKWNDVSDALFLPIPLLASTLISEPCFLKKV